MRVLIDALPVTNGSGTGYYVQKLVAALAHAESAHDFVIVTPPLEGADLDTTPWPGGRGAQLVSAAPAGPVLQALWRQWRLGPLARRHGATLVHYPAFLGSLRCRTPSVVTIPDLVWRTHRETVPPRRRQYYDRIIPRSMAHARRIITISDATLHDLQQEFPEYGSKACTVHLGVDRTVFRPETDATTRSRVRDAYRLPERYILALSTLEPRKNLPNLLRAFDALAADLPDVHLVLAGKAGYGADRLRALAQASPAAGRIHFPGHIAARDLPAVYSLADVFALPSLNEGFGLPILEAMACHIPVVTSDRSAMREVAGDGAELVDPTDPAAIAGGLRRVLTDDGVRARCIQRGAARAVEFTWARTAEQTLRVYEEAAA